MATLDVRLLGNFRLLYDGAPVAAASPPRLQALLGYLLLHRDAPIPRQHLAFLFWPDSSEGRAQVSLRVALHTLRRLLPESGQWLYADATTVQWQPDGAFTLDVAEFERAVARAEAAERAGESGAARAAWEQAASLYDDDLLPGCYDDWIIPQRERLRQMFATALERLAALLERQGEHRAALTHTQRLLRSDPLYEETYRRLMRLHALAEDRAGIQRVYQTCVTVLADELGIEPSPATRETYHRLLHAGAPPPPDRLRPRSTPRQLPTPATSFIGREQAIAEVKRLLGSIRVVTLTGPGGSGKSRLALRVAADLAAARAFPDGVWWVELAALADEALVAREVAAALGVRERADSPLLETLADFVRPKELLLVLDNCEHLIAACARTAEVLLRGCPNLRILATSREPLKVGAETTWLVPPLSAPDPRRLPPVGELTQYEAICLFVERAAAVLPTFRVTSHNAAALVEVCRRLDGIPLAIELAAARVKVLTVAQVAAHLHDAFRLLVRRGHAEAPRHKTLRATIDWSHDLLSPREQTLLRRLSVFVGGFALEAVEAVCAGSGLERHEILDLLSDLVDKSLVAPAEQDGPGGEARYRLLETLRQYSQEKLEASGEGDFFRWRHARYFLDLIEAIEPRLTTREQGVWLAWLEIQHDNLRAALAWARRSAAAEGAETALRLAGALWRFWSMRGYWSEGREWLESALSLPGAAAATAARGKALYGAGSLAYSQDDYRAARLLLEESVAVRRALGDKTGIAMSLQHLGTLAREQEALSARPDYTRAIALSEESLALFRELDHAMGVAGSLHDLGVAVMYQGDYAAARPILEQSLALYRQVGHDSGASHILALLGEIAWRQGSFELARSLLEESLAIRRELGYKYGIAESLGELGIAARLQGDLERAVGLLEESLALYRELGARRGIAAMLHHLGNVARELGNHEQAAACLGESLALSRDLGETQRIAECLLGLAGVYVAQERPPGAGKAARLLGAAEALVEAGRASLPASEGADHERLRAAIRGQLGEAGFASAHAEGRAMTTAYAVEYALTPA